MPAVANVPLGPMTSLRLGGAARRFLEGGDERELVSEVLAADARGEPVLILGGGSNLVLADEGFDGLVARIATRGAQVARDGGRVRLEVAAGEPWDALVARCVDEAWSGVECLSEFRASSARRRSRTSVRTVRR